MRRKYKFRDVCVRARQKNDGAIRSVIHHARDILDKGGINRGARVINPLPPPRVLPRGQRRGKTRGRTLLDLDILYHPFVQPFLFPLCEAYLSREPSLNPSLRSSEQDVENGARR